MLRLARAALPLLAFCPLVAQSRPSWNVSGDTTGAPHGCSAAMGIATIAAWFSAFTVADSAGLARATASPPRAHFVFSTGKFTPGDTFVRAETFRELLRYARIRASHHEHMTMDSVEFHGWRGLELGFMPFFARSADDLGPSPIAGIGKATYACGQGISVLNLAPRPTHERGARH